MYEHVVTHTPPARHTQNPLNKRLSMSCAELCTFSSVAVWSVCIYSLWRCHWCLTLSWVFWTKRKPSSYKRKPLKVCKKKSRRRHVFYMAACNLPFLFYLLALTFYLNKYLGYQVTVVFLKGVKEDVIKSRQGRPTSQSLIWIQASSCERHLQWLWVAHLSDVAQEPRRMFKVVSFAPCWVGSSLTLIHHHISSINSKEELISFIQRKSQTVVSLKKLSSCLRFFVSCSLIVWTYLCQLMYRVCTIHIGISTSNSVPVPHDICWYFTLFVKTKCNSALKNKQFNYNISHAMLCEIMLCGCCHRQYPSPGCMYMSKSGPASKVKLL